MDYSIRSESIAGNEGNISIKQSKIDFGTTKKTGETLLNPAELFLGTFASCIVKNVERLSEMMKFTYIKTSLTAKATRLEGPPRMEHISYDLIVYSQDVKWNIDLLKKNNEKFGSIYNTVKQSRSISGKITKQSNV